MKNPKNWLIIFLGTLWFFAGWPRIWQNPPIPPEIQEIKAAPDTIFYEGFESGDFTCGNCTGVNNNETSAWTTWSDRGSDEIASIVSTGCSTYCQGTYYMKTVGGNGTAGGHACDGTNYCTGVSHVASTTGYDSIHAEWVFSDCANAYEATAEQLAFDFSCDGGSTWISVVNINPTTGFSQSYNEDLSAINSCVEDNANVQIRIWQDATYNGEYIFTDEIKVTGTFANESPAAPTLHNVPFDNEKTGDSTPDFEFTASDPDGTADIIYHIQIDDSYNFSSALVDCESDSVSPCNAGAGSFTNTEDGGDSSPFTEGQKIRFTPTTAMTTGTTYYWRVRAEDDSGSGGSGSYGSWATIQSVTFVSDTDPSEWLQTTDEQFDTGTLSSTQTSGSDSVELGGGGETTVYLTSGATWNVPADWNSSDNTIRAIGAGGDGGLSTGSTNSGAGGGGGEYRAATNVTLTPSSTVDINIPSGGAGSSAGGAWIKDGTGGGASIVVEAKNGGNASGATAGSGGAGGTGATHYDGGDGGAGGSAAEAAGGGGGGSAGPTGAGKNGGNGYGGTNRGGGGGGGSNGGSSTAGETPTSSTGGAGGDGTSGSGGGAGGASNSGGDDGTAGGGGGGGGNATGTNNDPGGDGGVQDLWDTGVGPSGGGGAGGSASGTAGSGDKDGGAGGTYGGGGGGCGMSGTVDSGECDGTGVGGQGIIVITYTADASSGTIMSPAIDYDWLSGASSWGQVTWGEDETGGGTVSMQVYRKGTEDCDTLVSDSLIANNSTGIASGPISLTGLDELDTTHNRLCLKATLNMGTSTPYLNDWTVTWSSGAVVSVTITTDGVVEYGTVAKGASRSTIDLSDTQTAKNDGNVTETFNIKTSNATNGTSWTIGSSPGSNIFVHEFSTNSGSEWTKFSAADNYQTLATGIEADGTQDFDLRITVPTDSDIQEKTITITIQATE